jgi:hypothetical protein
MRRRNKSRSTTATTTSKEVFKEQQRQDCPISLLLLVTTRMFLLTILVVHQQKRTNAFHQNTSSIYHYRRHHVSCSRSFVESHSVVVPTTSTRKPFIWCNPQLLVLGNRKRKRQWCNGRQTTVQSCVLLHQNQGTHDNDDEQEVEEEEMHQNQQEVPAAAPKQSASLVLTDTMKLSSPSSSLSSPSPSWNCMLLVSICYSMSSVLLLIMSNRIHEYNNRPPFHYTSRLVSGSLGYAIAAIVSSLPLLPLSFRKTTQHSIKRMVSPQTNDDDALDNNNKEWNTITNILNIGLFLFSFIGIFVIPGEAAFHQNINGSFILYLFMLLAKCLGTYATFQRIIQLQPTCTIKERKRNDDDQLQSTPLMMISTARGVKLFTNGVLNGSRTLNRLLKNSKDRNKDSRIYKALFYLIVYTGLGNHVFSFFSASPLRVSSISIFL